MRVLLLIPASLLMLLLHLNSHAQDDQGYPHFVTPEEIEEYFDRGVVAPTDRGITSPPVFPNIRTKAEWEEVEAMTIAWKGYSAILKQIAAAAKSEVEVIILSENTGLTQNYLTSNNAGGPPMNLDNITIVDTDLNTIWIRDYMAHTVYGNEVDDRYMVDWIYNRPRPDDDVVPDVIGNLLNIDVYSTTTPPNDIMACGGNFMTDGFGRGFSSSLILDENQGGSNYWTSYPDHTVSEIEGIYSNYMGIDDFIVMQKLPYDGIHHIDMHMKLLDEETILVAKYPEGVADGPQIEANIEYVLNNFTTKWGTPFKVIEVPAPPQQSNGAYPDNGGDYLTYTNSVFVNKTIIVPTYYEQYDTTALRIYEEALPGYEVVGVNSNDIIGALGAIHCITHLVGVDDPLLISYQPLPDTDDEQNNYPVTAYINHKTGISDAVLYWKTDLNGAYSAVPMTSIGSNEWTAEIPAQPFGSTIYYYVEATAVSGKVQVRPIVAPEGYKSFRVINEVLGCADPLACNYDPLATVDDGSCAFVSGCTDPESCNYNPNAVCDDGSCAYGSGWFVDTDGDGYGDIADQNSFCESPCDGNIEVTVSGNSYLDEVSWTLTDNNNNIILSGGPYSGTQNGGSFSQTTSSGSGPFTFFIEAQGTYNDNNPNWSISTGTGLELASGSVSGGTNASETGIICSFANNNLDCDDSDASVNPSVSENPCNGIDDNCNGEIDENGINGCTDPQACNYNPNATCDDGSCELNACLDCNGDPNGSAFLDNCNNCVGGNTGETACVQDCNNEWGGMAYLDDCNICVGGNTGVEPCVECDLVVSTTSTPAEAGYANGSATVTVSGGVEPYTYLWDDPFMQTTATAVGLFPGTYTCTVSDVSGCEEEAVANIGVLDVLTGVTELSANFCNTSGYYLSDFISANQVSGATAYRWQFAPQGESALPEYTRYAANQWIRLQWVSGISMGTTYGVRVKVRVDGVWGEYGDVCTISTNSVVPLTEVLPNYTPTNADGDSYALCDFAVAYNIANATNFRWRFDPDQDPENGNEIYYTRGTDNPSVRLSWVNGLQPGTTYYVAVQVRVSDTWGAYGNVHLINLAPVSGQVTLRPDYCNQTYGSSGYLMATGVCAASYYQFRLIPQVSGAIRQKTVSNYALNLGSINPPLSPGTYNVEVRVSQNGVLGSYGPSCPITISGPLAQESEEVSNRITQTGGSATVFPNPNRGDEVRLQLSKLGEGNHSVNIHIFDAYGKLIRTDSFGHQGTNLSRLLRFDNELATGVYTIQVVVDEKHFTAERMIVN